MAGSPLVLADGHRAVPAARAARAAPATAPVATVATVATVVAASAAAGHERITLDGGASHGRVLTLHPPRKDAPPRTPIGGGWRHDYDIVLTARGAARVIHDGRGVRHEFVLEGTPGASSERPAPARRYRSTTGRGGVLETDGERHVWHRHDATRITFAGSVPVRIESASGEIETLRYAGGRLRTVRRANGVPLRFEHANGRLHGVALDDGTRWRLKRGTDGGLGVRRDDAAGECAPTDGATGHEPDDDADGDEAPERCDTAENPPPDGFRQGPGVPGAHRVDARPASCRSYFIDYAGTARGVAIESGLDGLAHYAGYEPTVRSFPIVDFVGEELRVVRSRDLASPSYDGVPDALFARLLADGAAIERQLLEPLARDGRLAVTELGRTTTLEHTGEERVVLELVVRHGLASPDQIRQIERARVQLLARFGLVLRVIEIP